jgi:predicted DNA-binding transcriptional regulator AlpA
MLYKEHGMASNPAPEFSSPERRIQAAAVRDLCGGVSDMWLWRRLDTDPSFPRPVYISKRRFWREASIVDWLEAQERERA